MSVRSLVILVLFSLFSSNAFAQQAEEVETLIKGDLDHGFVFSFDDKLSSIDGDFANFAGFHMGWLIDHSLLIGVAGYGTTDDSRGLDMGYGGFVVQYFFQPHKVFHYSVRTLIGGGGADDLGNHRHSGGHAVDGFFVAEPEVRLTLNILKPFRLGFGLGYRAVSGDVNGVGLSGPTFSISLKFGKF